MDFGVLYKKYEELKQKLELEGLFDEIHKKRIPYMPKVIGVLTSNTGAVIRDIINVSTRRNPKVNIRLLPVPVQGEGAAEKIASAIRLMNDKKLADVIILARGGGSIEDLWPFNEEIVAREIFNSKLPIVSAVGHETDFTIADFVADLRAPTPSAAAELVVNDVEDIKYTLNSYENRLKLSLKRNTEIMRLRYEKVMSSRAFKEPLQDINQKYILIDNYIKKMENMSTKRIKDLRIEEAKLISKLDALSPLKTLTRGFCIAEVNGNVITKAKELKTDMEVRLRFQDGDKTAKII